MPCSLPSLLRLNKLPSLLPIAFASAVILGHAAVAFGQGAAGDQPGTPAFNAPKFRDRLFEAGGPTIVDSNNGKIIADVIIEGNETISEHNILSRMQSRVDRPYDADILSRDIAELYRTGFFQEIKTSFAEPQPGQVTVRLKFTERPTINSIVFHGNKALDEKKLSKFCGFDKGDPISPHSVLAARNRLEELYRSEGFNQADIQVYQGDKPGDRDVVFRISEGPLERIADITFVGNQAFSSELLKTKLRSKDSNRFIPGLTTYLFNKAILETIEQDKQRLTGYYRSLGYFDARIEPQRTYDESGKWVSINFVISEGEQYFVRNVEIEGNQHYSTEKIKPYLELRAGDPFRQAKKDRDEKFLRDAYGAAGFIFADVVAQVRVMDGNQLDIVYSISEGDIYRASEINVHINGDKSYTKERVVLNYLGNLRPGDVINAVEVEDAERRLGYSTIFETNPAQGEPPRISIKPVNEVMPEDY